MFGISVARAAELCGGRLLAENGATAEINRITVDSRSVTSGDLFAAYKGEKVDGHDYIAAAFEKGAVCALAEHVPEGVTGPVILTEDVQKAIENLASAFRAQLAIPIVGITGSVGKTTAKEMTACVLARHFAAYRTAGNLNNTLGVPLSLSNIGREHEIAVIEMGINHFGEMARLGRMARPNVMIYTNIGHAHLEFLENLDGVLKAKTEVLPYLPADAAIIANGDDEKLRTLSCPQKILFYGFGENNDIRALDVVQEELSLTCTIACQNRRIPVRIPTVGRHNVYAALAAAAAGFLFGLTDEEIASGIAEYKTVGRRNAVVKTDMLTLIDDCYNANLDSGMAAIDTLSGFPGRKVCIFGDLLEQGENTEAMQKKLGQYAAEKGIDLVVGVGPLGSMSSKIRYPDKHALIADLPNLIREKDTVLVKASLGAHLEDVSEALKKLF